MIKTQHEKTNNTVTKTKCDNENNSRLVILSCSHSLNSPKSTVRTVLLMS